jgi:hypothetical protein
MRDLGKAFTFLFKDPSWVSKSLIAALWMILCIVGIGFLVLAGYYIQVTQRVMRREPVVLPGWNDIGAKLFLGLKFFAVFFIYLLPVLILIFPAVALAVAGEMSDNAELYGVLVSVYLFGFALFVIPFAITLTLLSPIICYRFAEREKIGDAIDIVRILPLFKSQWQNSLIVALITAALQSFAGIGILFLLVGVFFTIFYAYLVSAYMNGLLGLEQKEFGVAAQ